MARDDCKLGVMVIDWDKRNFNVRGIEGRDDRPMKSPEVLDALTAKRAGNFEVWALVYWPDTEQLCFYDEELFREEVLESGDDDDDDTPDEPPTFL